MEASKCWSVGCTKIAVAKGYCETHYKRLRRHGHVEQTRPADWGSREGHPLYKFWCSLRRHRPDAVCKEWLDDFWSFANEVKVRPDEGARHELYAIDENKLIGPGNWQWVRCQDRIDADSHKEYMRLWQRRMRAKDPFHQKRQDLKRYGVTLDWYHDQLERQNHTCAICGNSDHVEIKGRKLALSVDHCHATGKVRGLLCSACNRGIGLLGHDSKRLVAALDYLKRF